MNIKKILLLAIALLITPVGYAERYALVIGNSNYKIGLLDNPVNDASDMAVLLQKKGFKVQKLLNANEKQMKQAISVFTNSLYQKDAVGLFYFAGHGIEIESHNYLIPIAANIQSEADVEYESVDAGRVMAGMERAGNNLNMVILDACRDNPFARSFRSSSRGLAKMDTAKGSMVLYATSAGDVASDGSERNGLFTKHLMASIDTPNLTIDEVFNNTAKKVHEETQGKQFPWKAGSIINDFYFSISTNKVHLTIKASPENAKVRVLNIGSKYQHGIELNPGSYHVEVTHPGYQRYLKWIDLKNKDTFHSVVLEEKQQAAEVSPALQSRQSKTSSTPPQESYNGIKMVSVPSGCFQMGRNEGDNNETPVHRVCLSAYDLGKYEVTQAQWQQVMGNNPSSFRGSNKPVEQVSWNDVEQFIRKLNQQTGQNYRLPTEAEWEYACRSGGKDQTYCGRYNGSDVAWYGDDSGDTTHDVGQKQPNGLGFYDMSGNVWEWVQDWYDESYYSESPANNPKGSSGGSYRIYRGGSWSDDAYNLRSASRGYSSPGIRSDSLGFRLARTH